MEESRHASDEQRARQPGPTDPGADGREELGVAAAEAGSAARASVEEGERGETQETGCGPDRMLGQPLGTERRGGQQTAADQRHRQQVGESHRPQVDQRQEQQHPSEGEAREPGALRQRRQRPERDRETAELGAERRPADGRVAASAASPLRDPARNRHQLEPAQPSGAAFAARAPERRARSGGEPIGEDAQKAADARRGQRDQQDEARLTVHCGEATEVAVSSTMTVNPEGLINIYMTARRFAVSVEY